MKIDGDGIGLEDDSIFPFKSSSEIVLVGIYNQQFQGTIILMVLDIPFKIDPFFGGTNSFNHPGGVFGLLPERGPFFQKGPKSDGIVTKSMVGMLVPLIKVGSVA